MTIPYTFQNQTGPIPLSELDDNFTALSLATNVNFTQTGTGAVTQSVSNKLQEVVSVKDFGAIGDGTTDDTTAFVNADGTSRTIYVPKGTYKIGSNLTLSNQTVFEQGAILSVPTGVTVAINGGIVAGIYQVFSCVGTGAITFDYSATIEGYPEWWGAIPNSSTADCSTAINAAIVALQKTVLSAATYYCASTINITSDNKTLVGAGSQYKTQGSTRVLVKSSSTQALFVGYSVQPASINDFLYGTVIDSIYFGRTVAPLISSNCQAALFKFTLYTQIRNCKFDVSMRGAEFIGNVKSVCLNSYAFRSIAGTGSGTDYFHGFYVNGNTTIGSGGNASLYLNGCATSVGGVAALQTGDSNGVYADAGFADLYINAFEATTCSVGIHLVGNTSAYGNVDALITNPVIDQFYKAGILLETTSESGAISILGGYAAPAAVSQNTSWGIWCNQSNAQVSITNFQVICGPSTTCGGLLIATSKNVHSVNCAWNDSSIQSVYISSSSSIKIEDSIKHYNKTTAVGAVFMLGTCSRIELDCQVNGAANSTGYGYQINGAGVSLSQFNCSGLDSTSIAGGSTNKLNNNGTAITATGSFGTNNLAEGIMV